jgi:hypothetical protein
MINREEYATRNQKHKPKERVVYAEPVVNEALRGVGKW